MEFKLFNQININRKAENLIMTNLTKESKPLLKIGSLNTRGLNEITKLNCLTTYITRKQFHIFGISETKFNQKKYTPKILNQYHTKWSSHPTNNQAGVGILIHSTLINHLYNLQTFEGYIISAYFQFKANLKICITQIYIPHDHREKRKILKQLNLLITQLLTQNIFTS